MARLLLWTLKSFGYDIPFAFQNLGVLDIGIRPAHVLIVRSAGLTARLPTQISKSFGYDSKKYIKQG
jgi:hypothetical protein